MTEPPTGWTTPGQQPASQVPPWGAPDTSAEQPAWAVAEPRWQAAAQPGVIPLRPLGLGEILDGAIKIIRRYPRPTLGLSAATAVVVTIINVAFVLLLNSGRSTAVIDSSGSGSEFSSVPGSLVAFLAGLVLTGALVSVVGKAVLGQPASTAEVWATVKGRIWALLGLSLLTGLLVALPIGVAVAIGVVTGSVGLGALLVLLGAGGAGYLFIRLSLATPALVLEKAGIRAALTRSGLLVRGAWWRTFGILLLSTLIVLLVTAIATVPITVIAVISVGSNSHDTGLLVATQLLSGVASIFIAPFGAGVRAMVYLDRRMRAEGLDVSLQAAAAAPRPQG